jgi:protocatechuate 3,4-dioxygenase beta subunit
VRDNQPAAGTASIAGTIVSDTQPARPLRRAIVTLLTPDNSFGRTTVTDDGGRFEFAALPAGKFAITASKPGWSSMTYGARRSGRPGTSVQIDEAQRLTISIRLPKAAVITGTVLDPNGQPAAGVIVRAMRYSYAGSGGERRLLQSGVTVGPDERGVYRIYGLSPGEYLVLANSRSGFFTDGRDLRLTTDVDVQQALREIRESPSRMDAQASVTNGTPDRTVGFAPAYYPGTAMASQAATLTLRAGEERNGVDFAVPLIPTTRVDGVVMSSAGPAPLGTQVNLITLDESVTPLGGLEQLRAARVGSGGRFQFADVAPGQYTIAARVSLPAPRVEGRPAGSPSILWATTEIDVQGDPISGVSLTLQPGLTLTGTVRFEGSSAPPADLSSGRINFAPVGNQIAISVAATPIDASGRFTVGGLTPGRYRLTAVFPNARAWTLRSAVIAGQDSLDAPIDIRQPVDDAVLTFTDRPSELAGRVLNAAGAAAPDCYVILFSSDRTFWISQSRRILSARPASDASYTIRNIPPGDYLVAAVDDVEPGEWFDPAFLQRLVSAAAKISIADGEKKVQDITLGGG